MANKKVTCKKRSPSKCAHAPKSCKRAAGRKRSYCRTRRNKTQKRR